jgi:glucokinase
MAQPLPALGIDVGGSSAKIGIVSRTGEVLASCAVTSDPGLSAPGLLDRYIVAARELQAATGAERLEGIGIGLPGHIDAAAGTTRLCNVASLNGFPIAEHLSEKSRTAVWIENDATLAALGEFRFGAGRGSARFLTVTQGTGIGVGFIESGRPVHTANGTMGDIGHVIVDPLGARQCRHGCHGCLESVASALAMEERYASVLQDASGEVQGPPDLRGLFKAAKGGDSACAAIIADVARALAAAMATWLHIFAPDRIALAGGVSAAGEQMLDPIRMELSRLAMPDYLSKVSLVPAQLGNMAGLVGAAALCFSSQPHERIDP